MMPTSRFTSSTPGTPSGRRPGSRAGPGRTGRSPSDWSPSAPPGLVWFNPAGQPVVRSREGAASVTLVVTPGPSEDSQDKADLDRLSADEDILSRIDPTRDKKGPASDDQGRLTIPGLIPGATYRIYDNTMGEGAGPRLRKEFTVKPGETADLGDVRIESP